MTPNLPAVEVDIRAEFYDVDSMRIVWHGHYVRFLELGRCALLSDIGYGYDDMESSGYAWPVVDMRLKYIRPLRFGQKAKIRSTLLEYENRIKIGYLIFDPESGAKITQAETVQMAVDMKSQESLLASPAILLDKMAAWSARGGNS